MWLLHKVINTDTNFRQGKQGKLYQPNTTSSEDSSLKESRSISSILGFPQIKLKLPTLRFLMCGTWADPNMCMFFCLYVSALKNTQRASLAAQW